MTDEATIKLREVPTGYSFTLLRTGETFKRVGNRRRGPHVLPGQIKCIKPDGGVIHLSSRCEVRAIVTGEME